MCVRATLGQHLTVRHARCLLLLRESIIVHVLSNFYKIMRTEIVAVSYLLFLCSTVEDIQVFEPLMRLIIAFLTSLQARPTKHSFNIYGGCKGVLEQ